MSCRRNSFISAVLVFCYSILFSCAGCDVSPADKTGDSKSDDVTVADANSDDAFEKVDSDSESAGSNGTNRATSENGIADPSATDTAPLKRGEVPEEWKEPQRIQQRQIVADGQALDLTFDDLKFDIEVGEAFERSLLSESVKELDGRDVTLSGYMRPAFQTSGLKGFIFVRDNKECCFGPQAAIYDCVMVKMKKGVTADYHVRPIRVAGKFYLKEFEGPDGAIWAIFNMKDAKVL